MAENWSMTPHSRIGGFVLAGGRSRRMGRDKATLQWHHGSLLDHAAALLSTAADHVRIVGREDLPDRLPACGPLGGILTALEAADTEKNLVIAVDLPLLTPRFLRFLRRRLEMSDGVIVACKIGSDYPLCLGVHRSLAPSMAERIAKGKLAVWQVIEETESEVLDEEEIQAAGFDSSMFDNVNTPEDWERIRGRIRIADCGLRI